MPAKSLESKHTIQLIQTFSAEIEKFMEQIHSPFTTIPCIANRMGAMILADMGNFSSFGSSDKIPAFAGISPSTYQSVQLNN